MSKQSNRQLLNYLMIVFAIVFALEIINTQTSQLIWMIIWGVLVYISWQHYYRPVAQVTFWVSAVGLAITLLDTSFFRLILVGLVVYFLVIYFQDKESTDQSSHSKDETAEPVKEGDILFSNQWFGRKETKKESYKWHDINYQSVAGRTVIDLNHTVLPKDEPTIVIQQLFGTIEIIVPYDVEVRVHHSILTGSIDLFGYGDDRIVNRTVNLETENYENAHQRIRIYSTMIAGKIEVRRG